MPLYEFKCNNCKVTKTLFFHMKDVSTSNPVCSKCNYRLKRVYSFGGININNTFGSYIDKHGIKQPKEWFVEQRKRK